MAKLKRQAMDLSPKDLRGKADELEREVMQADREIHIRPSKKRAAEQKCVVNIINKTGLSDDWKFE